MSSEISGPTSFPAVVLKGELPWQLSRVRRKICVGFCESYQPLQKCQQTGHRRPAMAWPERLMSSWPDDRRIVRIVGAKMAPGARALVMRTRGGSRTCQGHSCATERDKPNSGD